MQRKYSSARGCARQTCRRLDHPLDVSLETTSGRSQKSWQKDQQKAGKKCKKNPVARSSIRARTLQRGASPMFRAAATLRRCGAALPLLLRPPRRSASSAVSQ